MRPGPPALATIAAAALLSLAQNPASAVGQDCQQAARLSVPYTGFVLPNGLRVVLHEDHRVPMVAVNVWYHVGSGNETPGRTGFAHLFEHLMFEGSGHVKEGDFDNLLEAAGGQNNGSTNRDRTNYIIVVPSNALELALFLESDRMGYLVDAMSPEKVDGQRDVVKNERRQSVENAPYATAESDILPALLFPEGHPYSWDTIGSMADLSAASYEDVVAFFKTHYVPNNATLVVAGDIDIAGARALVEKWFSDVPPGAPLSVPLRPTAALTRTVRKTVTDRVQLPRLYLAWLSPPLYSPGDAALDVVAQVLAAGKSSRLYKRLVYDLQVAQDVSAFQQSASLASWFGIVVTVRAHRGAGSAAESGDDPVARVQVLVDEELDRLRREPPTERELAGALNQIEAEFYDSLESLTWKADQLNTYLTFTGNPDWFNEDLSRYRALDPEDVRAAAFTYLADYRVELTVLPAVPDGVR